MKNSKVLIDTSIWIDYFRGQNKEVLERVKELIVSLRAALCGVILSEILSGVKEAKDREILEGTLDAIDYFEVSRTTWIRAGEKSSELRHHGVIIPLSDLVIAALAIENDCELFTEIAISIISRS